MSGNQKQASAVGPQQTRNYQNTTYMPRPQTPRTDFHVTSSQTYVPQQQPNQPGGQGQMRTIAPTGPPNQASTPPTNDLKVQQIPQQQSMNLAYVQQQTQVRGQQNFSFRPPVQNTQTQRMTNHRQEVCDHPGLYVQGQQTMYHQYLPVAPQPTTVYAINPMFYNNAGRTSYVAPPSLPVFTGQQMPYSFQPTQAPAQQQTFFYNQINVPRPAMAVPTGPQNPAQQPQLQMHPAQTTPQHAQPRSTKRRTHALAIINPNTGEDMLNEILDSNSSHPPSGESSARQTPQPPQPTPNTNKEVQATFAKQVAMVIGNTDGMSDIEQNQHRQVPQVQQAIDLMEIYTQQQPPPPAHPAVVLAPSPQSQAVNNKLEQVAQFSKLQLPTKEFVPSVQPTVVNLADKEPPVVSALTEGAEVTINKQPKERESPGKSRKQQQQANPRDYKEPTGGQHQQSQQQLQQPVPPQKESEKQQHEEVKAKEVQGLPPQPSKESKEVSNVEKKGQRKDKGETKASGDGEIAATQEHGKSKQNASHRGKDGGKSQQQQTSQQQNNQKHQQSVPVPQSQPPKPGSKASKIKELNVKGATKEGTDMDAFNDNVAPTPADTINANVTTNNNVVAATQPVPQQQAAAPQLNDNFNVNNVPVNSNANVESNKKTESIESAATTIKPVEPKPAPPKSNKVDVTAIVKDVPKIPKTFNIEPQDETDRAVLNNEKLVQAKNEVNAKANAENNESNVIEKPNLPYKEDQWAPFNPDGKKVYDREFLLALKNDPKSKSKPENIQLDVFKMIARTAGMTGGGRTDFTPSFNSFIGKSSSQHGVPPKRGSQNKMPSGGGGGGGGANNNKGSKQNIIRVSLMRDVKLHEVENAWKPARLVKGETMTDEDKKTDELYKKVRSVLNKLTPQKFNTLMTQVRSLTIDNTQRLQGVIDLVFEKAVDEPNFSYGYALMCKELALLQVPSTTADGKKKEGGQDFVNFRKLLITRCQLEFEKNSAEEIDRNKRCQEIEKCTDPEKKKELQLQLEEDDRRIRRKSVGNIRFLGELFKQNMLTVNIMMKCLENLLENKDEERLECLCKLLSTIGKELELDKNQDLTPFFVTMKEIVDKKHGKISSRVRFMLQDVIDLRKNKWVPRRQDTNPKTIDQIQKEAENEHLAIQAMNAMSSMPRSYDRGSSSGGGGGGSGGPGSDRKQRKNTTDDGWSTAPSRRPQQFTIQSNKLKNTRPLLDEPLGSRETFGVWTRGSTMKTCSSANPAAAQPMTTGNIYSALELEQQEKKSSSLGGGSSSRSNSKDSYSSKGPSMERTTYKQYNDDGRSSRSGSQQRSNDRSASQPQPQQQQQVSTPVNATPAKVPPQSVPQPEPEVLDEEQLERKVKNILDEYLNDCYDLEECNQDLKCSIPFSALAQVVSIGFMCCLERSKSARIKASYLFAHLLNTNTIPIETYCVGLAEVLSQAEDLRIDIPKIYNYLPELLVHPICTEVLRLEALHKSCESLISQGYAGKLLAPLLKLVVEEKGPNFLDNIWRSSRLQFTDFMPSDETDDFLKQNQLEFLVGSSDIAAGQSDLTYEQIEDKLLQMFKKNMSFNDQSNWIIANIGDRIKEKKFIRTLATAIFKDSIVNSKLNFDVLKNHYRLFQRFVDTNLEFELECLYALQALVNKLEHPQGILLSICSKLYDDGIFSQDGFVAWETSTDPAEMEGKGVALKQLTSFFTQLKENDEDEGSSASEEN